MPDNDVDGEMEEAGEANLNARLHPDPALPAARNGHPFRDYIANLHFK